MCVYVCMCIYIGEMYQELNVFYIYKEWLSLIGWNIPAIHMASNSMRHGFVKI